MLHVDLDAGQIETEERGPEYWERYIGGRGVGAKLLSEEDFRLDPYHPRMPVFFCTSPYEGTIASCNRTWVVTVSPLTGYYSCSAAGGFWGPTLRKARSARARCSTASRRFRDPTVRDGPPGIRSARLVRDVPLLCLRPASRLPQQGLDRLHGTRDDPRRPHGPRGQAETRVGSPRRDRRDRLDRHLHARHPERRYEDAGGLPDGPREGSHGGRHAAGWPRDQRSRAVPRYRTGSHEGEGHATEAAARRRGRRQREAGEARRGNVGAAPRRILPVPRLVFGRRAETRHRRVSRLTSSPSRSRLRTGSGSLCVISISSN